MRADLFKGPFLLLLWQVAPVQVQTDQAGRVQLSLGYGAGQFENRDLSCTGDILQVDPVPFKAGGAQLDYWPGAGTRVSAFGGGASGGTDDVWGGFQVAAEGRWIGAGIGLVHAPFEDMEQVPSTYVRLGSRDRFHFRAETFPPTTAIGVTGDVLRMGVGYNRGLTRGPRGFVGATIGPYADEHGGSGIFGEFELPVAGGLDLSLAGSLRESTVFSDGGFRAGVRYHFGR
ncbi:MAG TPA: hypothetical protein VD793_05070 [Gemmatimonadales bacterium]|nr:hypothetical protein [Gemmatimonadales bacterium]